MFTNKFKEINLGYMGGGGGHVVEFWMLNAASKGFKQKMSFYKPRLNSYLIVGAWIVGSS